MYFLLLSILNPINNKNILTNLKWDEPIPFIIEKKIDLNNIEESGDNSNDFNITQFHKINTCFEKQKILKKLESNISIHDKINIIKDNYIFNNTLGTNITAGGLLNDFNFDISP